MRDDLRSKELIPLKEPYSAISNYIGVITNGGKERIGDPSILKTTGSDAIVDWVFVELRNPSKPSEIMATRSALVQRDGDVVDVDGVSPVHFQKAEPGNYLVAVRHRNHLGVMSAQTYNLSDQPQELDFSDPATPTYGTHAQIQIGERMAMWGGDVDHNGKVTAEGPENDKDRIFFATLLSPENAQASYNYIVKGYQDMDVNMDGEVKYQGPGSDGSYLFFDIVFFWQYNCPLVDKDCQLVEQLPR